MKKWTAFAAAVLLAGGCSTTGASHERALAGEVAAALVATEASYQACQPWFPPPSAYPIIGLHSTTPRCLELRQSRTVDWCETADDVQRRAWTFIASRRPALSRSIQLCVRTQHAPVEEAQSSVMDAVSEWIAAQHGDALELSFDAPARVNLNRYPLSALTERCQVDALWHVRGQPRRVLSRGEALLCAEMSPSWAQSRLDEYWPELSQRSDGT